MAEISIGDGTWQTRLDAGQCPKCLHKLEYFDTKKNSSVGVPLM